MQGAALLLQQQSVFQVIKHQLLVGAVGNITGISGLALVEIHTFDDGAHCQAQELVDRAHPFGVATHQEIVNGDNMYRDARQGSGRRLALPGFHFGDHAL